MGKRFLVWVAVSSKEQAEKVSPEVQQAQAVAHVERWGGEVVDVLSVAESRDIVLLSDAEAAIPAYARLHDYIRRKAFDVLVCYDLTRLGRTAPLILAIAELCSRASILIYQLDSPPHTLDVQQDSYEHMLVRALQATSAQHEVSKLKARSRYGHESIVKKGRFYSAPPYGYEWQYTASGKRTVAVDDAAAAVVRRIIAAYLAGTGILSIADDLRNDGIPSPGGGSRWMKNSAAAIIERVWTYAGYSELRRDDPARYIRAPGDWPALIDESTAERVESERKARAGWRRIADTQSRLTSIVVCEMCGRPMRQVLNEDGTLRDSRNPDSPKRRAKFYCVPNHAGGYIGTNRIVAALEVALDELARRDLSAIPDDDADRAAQYADRLAAHDAAIARHAAALRRADTAYVSGNMDDERYREQVKRLRSAIELEQSAQTQIRSAQEADRQRGNRRQRLEEVAARGRAMLTTPDTAAANAWFRQYVRVFVRDNQVTEVRFL